MLDTTVAAAGPQMLVKVTDRLSQAGVVGGQDRPAGGRITQAVEDRDTLGRPQDHVEAGHGGAAMGTAQQLPVVGSRPSNMAWTPAPMLRPPARGCWRRRHTSGPGTRRARTDTARGRWPAPGCNRPPAPPSAWRCRPPPRRSLPRLRGASNAPVVHCSSEDFGSSVERTATLRPLWQWEAVRGCAAHWEGPMARCSKDGEP